MRYVQINSFYNGSTGTIMRNLHKELKEQGIDSYIFWGRRHETISDHEICCASKLGVYAHGALSRLTDRAGFYSKRDTRRLLERLEAIDPDVVHLHNIHGYYINIEMLFEWLANHRCQVKWTLHDCWAFTGHCSHFTYVGCERWRDGCHDCPQKKEYPRSFFADASEKNFSDKKRLFNLIPDTRMEIVVPSRWLANLANRSFLSKFSTIVKHNKIDCSVFKPTPNDFRERYGLEDKFVILGVASPWTERKGLDDFIELRSSLDETFAIILIGLSWKQRMRLPEGILGLGRTETQNDLASFYTTADVFFNPTHEDNYPTVNLEAEACGASVITYDTGGCGETIKSNDSHIVQGLTDAMRVLKKYVGSV
ncbi:glycosyltransferase [Eggerthella timonensis]|uniref:glycosyltransferase n=1 Tax=Eggerthella timonensis TaxID=1871008 RepID=UPI000C75C5CD|nr:glycosyltransferase [Eggerthella timonensis]